MPYKDIIKRREKQKLYSKKYRERHLDEIRNLDRARQKIYRQQHFEERREYDRERSKLPHRRELQRRRILFIDKPAFLKDNPRKGVCSECGKIGLTHIHHDKYDNSDVLAHTRELCVGCHNKVRDQPRDPLTGRFIRGKTYSSSP